MTKPGMKKKTDETVTDCSGKVRRTLILLRMDYQHSCVRILPISNVQFLHKDFSHNIEWKLQTQGSTYGQLEKTNTKYNRKINIIFGEFSKIQKTDIIYYSLQRGVHVNKLTIYPGD